MGKQKKQQAVAYLRVSSATQVDGGGISRQREALEAYAGRAGLDVVGEYRDEGVSGTKELEHRQGLSELLERVRSNGVRLVLVERSDRLARDLIVGELILSEFRKAGVTVRDALGNDLTEDEDPTRVLIRQVLGAMAQFDKSSLVGRMRAGRDRVRAATGRCEGRKPFGHYPGEAATLRRARAILGQHKAGKRPAYAAVARQLNEEGRATRTGVKWSPAMVRRVLSRG